MRKLTALQYTIFMIAALAMLIAVPSAYAATVQVAQNSNVDIIQNLINNAGDGDTLVFADGTYADINDLNVTKSLTLKPQNSDSVTFTGYTQFRILSSNVVIAGFVFDKVTQTPIITKHDGTSNIQNITIANNTISNTTFHGLYLIAHNAVSGDYSLQNLVIKDNTFENIGFYNEDNPGFRKATNVKSAIFSPATHVGAFPNLEISGNTVTNATYAGIAMGGVNDGVIKDNVINNTDSGAIVMTMNISSLHIENNTIANAISDAWYQHSNPARNDHVKLGELKESAITVWAGAQNVYIRNNTISDSKAGVLFCSGICMPNPSNLKLSLPQAYHVDTNRKVTNSNVTHNTFENIDGFELDNQASNTMVATHNYYGVAVPDFTKILSGDVHYNPYYSDPERRVLVDDGKGTVQKSTADLDVSDVCSISLGTYIMDFADAKYGATSGIVQNQIKNAGNQDLGGIKFTSTGWQKPDGSALSNAISKVGTDVTSSASYTPIPTNQAGINFNAANFTGSNTLPASGSPDSALVGFVLDLTGVATGAGVTVTESVTYSATCS